MKKFLTTITVLILLFSAGSCKKDDLGYRTDCATGNYGSNVGSASNPATTNNNPSTREIMLGYLTEGLWIVQSVKYDGREQSLKGYFESVIYTYFKDLKANHKSIAGYKEFTWDFSEDLNKVKLFQTDRKPEFTIVELKSGFFSYKYFENNTFIEVVLVSKPSGDLN